MRAGLALAPATLTVCISSVAPLCALRHLRVLPSQPSRCLRDARRCEGELVDDEHRCPMQAVLGSNHVHAARLARRFAEVCTNKKLYNLAAVHARRRRWGECRAACRGTFQARPWRGRAARRSRGQPTCCNGGWLRCSTCWPSCRERTNAAGAQLNAEAVEVNQYAHVHAVGCSGATGRRQAARSAPQELLQGLLCEIIVPMIDALLLLFMALML